MPSEAATLHSRPSVRATDVAPKTEAGRGRRGTTVPRSELVDRDVVRRLSKRDPLAVARRLGFDGALIIAAAVVCELFWSPALYVLAVMVIGARQVGIGTVALHDGAHRLLSRNRRRNDRVARVLCIGVGVPIFDDFDQYRERHLEHHRSTNTEDDPEGWIVEKFNGTSRWKAAMFLGLALGGALFAVAVLGFLRRLWKSNRAAGLAVAALAFALVGAAALGFYPAVLLVMYWIVPLATWGLFINLVRSLAEHYPEGEFGEAGEDVPEIFHTRDVLNSWFDQIFVVTRGVNYHLTHHLIACVPFYRLSELQRELAKSAPYRKHAHVTRGYHRFLLEYFFHKFEPSAAADEAGASGLPRALAAAHGDGAIAA